MIQMRWLQDLDGKERRLQYRYRRGAISVVRAPIGAGIALDPNDGWSPWKDVPIVPEEMQEEKSTNETA